MTLAPGAPRAAAATAALLRAVADNHLSTSRNETCGCEWDGRYTDKRCAAALALADVILGGSDE